MLLLRHEVFASLVLVACWLDVETKGIISFGKNTNRAQARATDVSPNSDGTAFRFALLTPTARIGTASTNFLKFIRHATETQVYGYDHRAYYFVPHGVNYDKAWLSDSNVCYANVKAWKLTPHNYVLNETESWVVVHFLCDQYCCGPDCCDLNVLFLVCLIFIIIVIIFFLLWLCCRYGRQRCARIKRLQELTVANAMESSQMALTESSLLDGDDDYHRVNGASEH